MLICYLELKNELWDVQYACFDSWDDLTSVDCIGIVVFPMDPMDPIGLLSNPSSPKESQNIVYTSVFILSVTRLPLTQMWTRLYFRFNFSTRLHSNSRFCPLDGVWLRVLNICESVYIAKVWWSKQVLTSCLAMDQFSSPCRKHGKNILFLPV